MKYATLDLLACPRCKYNPLSLLVIKEEEVPPSVQDLGVKPLCSVFCGYHNKYIAELELHANCSECLSKDIAWGILYCPKCGSSYPIAYGIPMMYPGYLSRSAKLKVLYKIIKNKLAQYSPNHGGVP
uniref:Trm112 family protein n=1 Tax=Ignisphaera aggregans TaxID=334771 RepID=A0A7C2VP24_9CREN